jgi:hypothetical protein
MIDADRRIAGRVYLTSITFPIYRDREFLHEQMRKACINLVLCTGEVLP